MLMMIKEYRFNLIKLYAAIVRRLFEILLRMTISLIAETIE